MPEPCCITTKLPGIGGILKNTPEDFMVEEIPLYELAGKGEHLYLFVQKRNITTLQCANALSRHFGVRPKEISYAGLKDKRAVTRQLFSIHQPRLPVSKESDFSHDRISILWTDRHVNKIQRGHLIGNRFVIRIREVQMQHALAADKIMRVLYESGMPNRIGEQRFGYLGNNHLVGQAIIQGDGEAYLKQLLCPATNPDSMQAEARDIYAQGDYRRAFQKMPRDATTERQALRDLADGLKPEQIMVRADRRMASFFVSAFQSWIFNMVLSQRMSQGTLDQLLPGDIVYDHANRTHLQIDESNIAEQAEKRFSAGLKLSPTGPMWGLRMQRTEGLVDQIEHEALLQAGVTMDQLAALPNRVQKMMQGARRPFTVPIIDPDIEGGIDEHGAYVRCAFELPKGSFATTLLHEIMKPDQQDTPEN